MNNFEIGYYDALLENYDILNEAEKSKLKQFLKKHKKKLIAGAALLGTAGAAVGGGIAYNNHKNFKKGKELLKVDADYNNAEFPEEVVNKNKKAVRSFGKAVRTFDKGFKQLNSNTNTIKYYYGDNDDDYEQ